MSEDDDDSVELWTREETELLEIVIGNSDSTLRLRQYGSHDERWGIHSCVWDGGLALLQFLTDERHGYKMDGGVAIDLGAGTGIVGLGMAKECNVSRVLLTDLPEAIPLLEENVELNQPFSASVMVEELSWGEPELPEAIQTILSDTWQDKLCIMGADIVYRQNLFVPLLTTLQAIYDCRADAEFWFGSQSTRLHLKEFWNLAQSNGWKVVHHANVVVAENEGTLNVSSATPQTKVGIVNVFQLIRDKAT